MGSKLKRFLQPICMAIILASLLVFLGGLDFNLVLLGLQEVGFSFVALLLISFTAYLLASLSWKVCLGREQKPIALFSLFAIRQVGETLALLNPTSIIAGDWLKIHLLQQYKVEYRSAKNSVLISRLTSVLSQMVLLFCTSLWLLCRDQIAFLPAW